METVVGIGKVKRGNGPKTRREVTKRRIKVNPRIVKRAFCGTCQKPIKKCRCVARDAWCWTRCWECGGRLKVRDGEDRGSWDADSVIEAHLQQSHGRGVKKGDENVAPDKSYNRPGRRERVQSNTSAGHKRAVSKK